MSEQKPKEKQILKLNVKKARSKKKYKDNIITALYESGLVQNKVKGICMRNKIKRETYIQEDIVGEVFYYLSKKNPDEIIEMYETDQSRLLGLAVVIAVRQGVGCLNTKDIYPKHSVAKQILFTSNLNKREPIAISSENGYIERPKEEDNDILKLWTDIEDELSSKNKMFINELYKRKEGKKRGALSLEQKEKYNHLLQSVKSILQTNNYKING
jgi:hypothetical protein